MRKNSLIMCATVLIASLSGCTNNKKIKMLPYPQTMKEDVIENYHGTNVSDPYRWLEDDNSAQTAEWVAQQNTVTFDYLAQIPFRNSVKERLTQLWNYAKLGTPTQVGDYYFYLKNDGLQNQSVLYRKKGLNGEASVFLDPNTMSSEGTVALSNISFSDDNKYMSYAVAASGSDWVEIKVMDVETKATLSDEIKWVKFSGANWSANSQGFYYSRYDEPVKGSELSGQNRFQKVYYHKLGQLQSEDLLIWEDKANPLRYFSAEESHDGKYIFVTASEGTHGNEIIYRETTKETAPFKPLFAGFENDYIIATTQGDTAYIYTNQSAANYRLVSINLANPQGVTDIIAHNDNLLQGVGTVGGNLMAFYLENAKSAVYQHDMAGKLIRKVELPGIGTVDGFDGKKLSTETFYSLTSYTAPATIYKYNLADGKSEIYNKPEVDFNPELYTTDQVFFKSADGTPVSMFIVHRTDMKLNGKNPLYLYGYGGFNISLTPSFNPSAIMFMEQGGVLAFVNLRGGGEYGETWHKAGMLDKKQNVFDDFIGAAEYMIANKYSSASKIAIAGGSNGGLLVGACMVQRPDLFAVALPAVGVLDMLRYHKFTVGWGWAVEYGSSDKAEQFAYIYKYSPLHNIKSGVCYPATLITTGDHDDRVVPAHSFKFAATLQEYQACDKPVLIRIDTNAGHGAGKPTTKRIDEAADVYSFVLYNTDTKVDFKK